MTYEIGKRIWITPQNKEAIIDKCFYTPAWMWKDPEIPELGNVRIKYNNGFYTEVNYWQINEVQNG